MFSFSFSCTAARTVSNDEVKEQKEIKNGLLSVINRKKRELDLLVLSKKNLQDPEVYQKSCELDVYIVKYMRYKQAKE